MQQSSEFPEDGRVKKSLFEELARAPIKEGTTLVISLKSDGLISIAQQVVAYAGGKLLRIFLKNAIEVSPSDLITVKETIEKALTRYGELEATYRE